MYEFEMGPIRPPSEAYSVLLRITRNCPWNKCAFCPVYKGQKFSLRSVEEIKSDIDAMYTIAQKVYERISQNGSGQFEDRNFHQLLNEDEISQHHLQQMLFWMHYGMKSLFLQDADSMVMKPGDLVDILKYIRVRFPSIERITCYSRSKTLVARSPEELKEIRSAGLNRIHIGMESGSDAVLKLIKKGVTGEEHISSGRKVVEAGFELSEYFMPGIGGKNLTDENAEETAKVLNAINPHFIRIRTTTPVPGTELRRMMDDGEWIPLSEKGRVQEIRNMVALLNGITSYVQSDHMMNLIEDANGKLPDDKDSILSHFDRFLNMGIDDQECFIIGRRTGQLRFLADYARSPHLESARDRMKSMYGTIDNAAMELSGRFL